MKKILIIVAAFSLFSSSCHYGKEEAGNSLDRNDKYKGIYNERKSPAVSDDYLESHDDASTDTSVKTTADSTVTK